MINKIKKTAISLVALEMAIAQSVLAETQRLNNPIKSETFSDLITAIIDFVLILATPILVIAIIIVGFQFVWAQGKPEKLKNAKSNLWYTLLGAAIIIGVKLIQAVLEGTVGAITN